MLWRSEWDVLCEHTAEHLHGINGLEEMGVREAKLSCVRADASIALTG